MAVEWFRCLFCPIWFPVKLGVRGVSVRVTRSSTRSSQGLLPSAASCQTQTCLGKQRLGSALRTVLCSLQGHSSIPWYNATGFVRSTGYCECALIPPTACPAMASLSWGVWVSLSKLVLPYPSVVGPALRTEPVTCGKVRKAELCWGLEQRRRFLEDVGQKSNDLFFSTSFQVWANKQRPDGRLTNRLGCGTGLFCMGWRNFQGSVAFMF